MAALYIQKGVRNSHGDSRGRRGSTLSDDDERPLQGSLMIGEPRYGDGVPPGGGERPVGAQSAAAGLRRLLHQYTQTPPRIHRSWPRDDCMKAGAFRGELKARPLDVGFA